MKFNEGLNKIGSDLQMHAKLINTFSLMEYMGARKIMKSQHENNMTEALLSHIAEEVRHAMTLKRLALKMSEGALHSFESPHLLGGHAAHRYMQKVDRGAAELLNSSDSWKNYLVTTWLIEERALKVYPHYEEIMTVLGHKGYFQMILKDEEKHSQFIADELRLYILVNNEKVKLFALEETAFAEFCSGAFGKA